MDDPDFTSHILLVLLGVTSAALLITLYRCIVVTCFGHAHSRGPQRDGFDVPDQEGGAGDGASGDGPSNEVEMLSGASTAQLLPPVSAYGGGGGRAEGKVWGDEEEGAYCAVCLSGFRDGEAIRVLPACSHYYHAACIDGWLRRHCSCPVCREQVNGQLMPQAGGPLN